LARLDKLLEGCEHFAVAAKPLRDLRELLAAVLLLDAAVLEVLPLQRDAAGGHRLGGEGGEVVDGAVAHQHRRDPRGEPQHLLARQGARRLQVAGGAGKGRRRQRRRATLATLARGGEPELCHGLRRRVRGTLRRGRRVAAGARRRHRWLLRKEHRVQRRRVVAPKGGLAELLWDEPAAALLHARVSLQRRRGQREERLGHALLVELLLLGPGCGKRGRRRGGGLEEGGVGGAEKMQVRDQRARGLDRGEASRELLAQRASARHG